MKCFLLLILVSLMFHVTRSLRWLARSVPKLYRSVAMPPFVARMTSTETSAFNYKDADGDAFLPPSTASFLGNSEEIGGSTKQELPPVDFKRGTEIQVRVVSFGPLGASVTIDEGAAFGMILQGEIALYRDKTGDDPKVGDRLTAYVQRVRKEDNRVNVSLRPLDKARIGSVAEQVLEALEGSPLEEIPVGDKSPPEDIASYFYGISKKEFKNAVGTLFKEGKVKPGPHSTRLLTDDEYEEFLIMKKEKEEKDKYTMFVGNLPHSINDVILRNAILKKFPDVNIKSIRIPLMAPSGEKGSKAKGFAYVEMDSNDDIVAIIEGMKNTEIMGRRIRTDSSVVTPSTTQPKATSTSFVEEREGGDRGDSPLSKMMTNRLSDTGAFTAAPQQGERREPIESIDGPRDGRDGQRERQPEKRGRNRVAATLFVGNLSYQTTEGDLRDMIADFLGGRESIVRVNVATERETGHSRGFAHVDFTVEEDAKRVFQDLHDEELHGRKLNIDRAGRKQ